MPELHTLHMKTVVNPGRKAQGAASLSKWVICGPEKRPTRESLLHEDAAFLARMSHGSKVTQSSIELVREGR
jgi:hypothetical protein